MRSRAFPCTIASTSCYTLTFEIGIRICLFIFRKSSALYDTIRVYTFIIFAANPPYTIFIWSMFISSPILWVITSPAACLEAHPAGVPGNCNLPASLSLRPPGTRKLLLTVSKNLRRQSYQRLHLVNNYTVCHSAYCLCLIDT